ncbi:MAG: DUF255 domain-containing protein [Bacteroidetes bacterium]|nr:MAG: DUF255 domain-containing protein [Bacteroidota bacterium]
MRITATIAGLVLLVGLWCAFAPATHAPQTGDGIRWMSWEEAVAANEKVKKKFIVDVYTKWCGWCKRMDATTFKDPAVVDYINEHFYAVKLDAEQKEDITFQGTTFSWVEGGRNGVHTLAYSLLDGRLSYPSIVYLTENYERITISPGFKQPADLMKELKWVAEELYTTIPFQQYRMQH